MAVSAVQSTRDVDEFRAAIRPTNTEFLLTGRGRFAARVTKVDFSRLATQLLEETLPRSWRLETLPSRSSIWFLAAPGPPPSCGGVELGENEIGLLPGATTAWHRLSGPAQLAAMSLPREGLAELSIAVTGRDVTPPRGAVAATVSAPVLARVRRLHARAMALAAKAPGIFANPGAAAGLEQALTEAMLACLADGETREDRAAQRRHRAIVGRLTELAEAQAGRPLYLGEVCAAVGVTERTLRLCCEEQFGMSPKRYLTMRRMHLARQALLAAPGGEAAVTEVATRFGFWELGRFAVAYRSVFGESPSQTLRHARARWGGANADDGLFAESA